MSGRLCASSTNCAARWHWDVEEACKHYTENEVDKQDEIMDRGENSEKISSGLSSEAGIEYSGSISETNGFRIDSSSGSKVPTAGRPVSLLDKIGLSDLLEKWPKECIPMGGRVGRLTKCKILIRRHSLFCFK